MEIPIVLITLRPWMPLEPRYPHHTTAEAARATRLATMMWSGSTDWRIGKQGCAVAHESAWYSFDICGGKARI